MKDLLQLKPLLSLSYLCPFFSFLSPNSPHLFLYHCTARRGEKQIWVVALFKKQKEGQVM